MPFVVEWRERRRLCENNPPLRRGLAEATDNFAVKSL